MIFLLYSLTANSNQDLSPSLNTKLLEIYSNLLLDLEACINDEGLEDKDRLKTACNADNLHPFQNILFQTQYKHISFYLDGFEYPEPAITVKQHNYPTSMHAKSRNGVVVIVFSIDKEGKTFNHKVFSSTFTYTKRERGSECQDEFCQEALRAALALRYKPATYLGSPIVLDGIKVIYRFVLDENKVFTSRGGAVELNKVNKLIDKGKLQKAKEKSLEKIDDYDINAQNELLKYLDNEKKNNILDTTDLVNKSISSDTINNSFNNLNTDLYTFDDVPTHSNSTLEQDNIVDNINDVSGYYESDNQYYSLT